MTISNHRAPKEKLGRFRYVLAAAVGCAFGLGLAILALLPGWLGY